MTTLKVDARQFSENLQTAARWYEKRDRDAAEAITKIEIDGESHDRYLRERGDLRFR